MSDQKKLPDEGFYQAKITYVRFDENKTINYKDKSTGEDKSFTKDELLIGFSLMDTKDQNDGEKDFIVFYRPQKFPKCLYEKGKTNVRDSEFISKIFIKAFGEQNMPEKLWRSSMVDKQAKTWKNDLKWEGLKEVRLTVEVAHTEYKGKFYADIVNVSPPESPKAREANIDRLNYILGKNPVLEGVA